MNSDYECVQVIVQVGILKVVIIPKQEILVLPHKLLHPVILVEKIKKSKSLVIGFFFTNYSIEKLEISLHLFTKLFVFYTNIYGEKK